jgi:acyl-CoA oxidase
MIIAEGDVVTLCIRLCSELLQGHYTVPLPPLSDSLLAQHAHSLLEENRTFISTLSNHRGEEYNAIVLPQSQGIIEALGHALAYSAAKRANLPQPILDVYECSVIKQDPAWYSEHGLSKREQLCREDKAVSSAMPHLATYIRALNVEKYVQAPIVSDAAWRTYLSALPVHSGNGAPSSILFPSKL